MFKVAAKSGYNPHFKSHFSTEEDLWEASHAGLQANGLCLLHFVEGNALTSILLHISGQWFGGSYPLNPTKGDPQSFGICVSYAKRYMRSSLTGVISGDVDDDANDQSVVPGRPPSSVPKNPLAALGVARATSRASGPPLPGPSEANYVVQFGKLKGLRLGSIPKNELRDYVAYLVSTEASRPLSETAKELVRYARVLLDGTDVPEHMQGEQPPLQDVPF
jgi:hypothetical protein